LLGGRGPKSFPPEFKGNFDTLAGTASGSTSTSSRRKQGPTGLEWRADDWSGNTAPADLGFVGGGSGGGVMGTTPDRRRQSTAAAEAERTFTPGRSRASHRQKSSFFKKGADAQQVLAGIRAGERGTAGGGKGRRSPSPDHGAFEEGSAITELQSYDPNRGHDLAGYSVGSSFGHGPLPLPAVSEEGRAALMAMTRGKIASHYSPKNLSMEYSRTLNAKHRRTLVLDTAH
jgi:hypothetical protein